MPSGRPSIGASFHARVERYLKEHPELGYKNTGELVRDLLRAWMRDVGLLESGTADGTPHEDRVAADA